MQRYLTGIFDRLLAEQEERQPTVCPRCGRPIRRPIELYTSLANGKEAHIVICGACDTDNFGRDFETDITKTLSKWYVVKKALEGKTFMDLLCSGRELDCDLIIGGSDMPATLVWNSDCRLTVHGADCYAALLKSPYEELPNGNIEVLCDNYKLGEHFTRAAAGYIALSEYRKLFSYRELTREEVSVDGELTNVINGGIQAYFKMPDSLAEAICLPKKISGGKAARFHATYYPLIKHLRCSFTLGGGTPDKDTEHEYYPTANEAGLVKGLMEEASQKQCGCALSALYRPAAHDEVAGQKTKWIVTDDSCWQCCRRISEKAFELIQIIQIGNSHEIACGIIDLDAYTVKEWEAYATLYGHSGLRGFISDYDQTFPARILAEYVFETNWHEHLGEGSFGTLVAAVGYIAGIVDCKVDAVDEPPADHSVLFSRVEVFTEGDGGGCEFCVGGIPRELDDLKGVDEFDSFMESERGEHNYLVVVTSYTYGSGECEQADEKELAVIRNKFIADKAWTLALNIVETSEFPFDWEFEPLL